MKNLSHIHIDKFKNETYYYHYLAGGSKALTQSNHFIDLQTSKMIYSLMAGRLMSSVKR